MGKDDLPVEFLIAGRDGDVETLNVLLAAGMDPNANNIIGQSALHFACMHGHAGAASALLYGGADVNCENDDGESPLFFAARNGHVDVVRILIERGAKVSELRKMLRSMGHGTPRFHEMLQLVAMHNRPSVLARAVRSIDLDLLQTLLDAGKFADKQEWVDLRGRTPLHYAVAAVLAIVSMRVEDGCDEPPFGDSDGLTALEMLVKAAERTGEGAMGEACDCLDDEGLSPLHMLVQAGRRAHPTALSMLLRAGANPNVQSTPPDSEYTSGRWGKKGSDGGVEPLRGVLGGTPLHAALDLDAPSTPIVNTLLEYDADVNIRDGEQRTALHLALDFQEDRGGIDLDLCELLLAHKADPSLGSHEIGLDNSCLHAACIHNEPSVVALLLRHRADHLAAGKAGWTPLTIAVRGSASRVVEALLAAQADPNTRAPGGKTVRELAALNRSDAVHQLLERAAASTCTSGEATVSAE